MKKMAMICCAGLVASAAGANEFEPAIRDYVDANVMSWVNSDELVSAVMRQNQSLGQLDADAIDALDQQWRAEVGTSATPTIDPVLNNSAADFLRERDAASSGVITEIFIMDHQGLNVAASDTTSDYWQGDEAKFQKTYPMGAGTVFIDEIEFDESTQTYQAQVSVTLSDPKNGQPIGAVTVGLNADELF